MRSWFASSLLVLSVGCGFVTDDWYQQQVRDVDGDGSVSIRFGGPDCRDQDPSILVCDSDGDGERSVQTGGADCDDQDATVHPGATEICNGQDEDCDGLIDDADPSLERETRSIWYRDVDGDGYGDSEDSVRACAAPAGTTAQADDCDDQRDDVSPAAQELCDTVDHDCDGDPRQGAADVVIFYLDQDVDGFGGDTESGSGGCPQEVPEGASVLSTDCDDHDPASYPGAAEVWYDGIDQNCDGQGDLDQDRDGYELGVDCDDQNANRHPAAAEICNDVDDDCDTLVDADDPDVANYGGSIFFADADGDGHGDPDVLILSCDLVPEPGQAATGMDCDDADPTVSPDGAERCNAIDDDCDGLVDENAVDAVQFYIDLDADGWGGAPTFGCALAPGQVRRPGDCDDLDDSTYPGAVDVCGDGFRQDCDATLDAWDCDGDGFIDVAAPVPGTDCDDTEPLTHPGGQEVCGPLDEDCDGLIDDDDPSLDLSSTPTYERDEDGDGYGGGVVVGSNTCAPPEMGAADQGGDCDDLNPTVSPAKPELCNGYDDDCDGLIDTDDPSLSSAPVFYWDADGDGYGDAAVTLKGHCVAPENSWVVDIDCNDQAVGINPGQIEVCNGLDDDCDGDVDQADANLQAIAWYLDNDGDGWGQSGAVMWACTQPSGYSLDSGDCDDSDQAVGAVHLWYRDADGDGYGDSLDVVSQCQAPAGRVLSGGDCDDQAASVHPGAPEVCDLEDNDCDGLTDDEDPVVSSAPLWFEDLDGDGVGNSASMLRACTAPPTYVNGFGDCDDTNPAVSPFRLEGCDGIDNDCDGIIDTDAILAPIWYPDLDQDGWGTTQGAVAACTAPVGSVALGGDCDDTRADTFPAAPELCDGVDNNCNGVDDAASPGVAGTESDDDGDGFAECDGDCDDTNSAYSPSAIELCDGVDNDCDGLVDDADPNTTGQTLWHPDVDQDGFGDGTVDVPACVRSDSLTDIVGDCDDSRPDVYPGAAELCDNVDNDCDTLVDSDDPNVVGEQSWYLDTDDDGYGVGSGVVACAFSGRATLPGDCDDTVATVHPGALEACNGRDDDCNGADDAGLPGSAGQEVDGDSDGWWACQGDCDDTDPRVQPGQTLAVPADFPAIQAAVDAACSPGVVQIAAGLWNEQVRLNNKTLTLVGAGPSTIIEAAPTSGGVLEVLGGTVTVRDLDLQGGPWAVWSSGELNLQDIGVTAGAIAPTGGVYSEGALSATRLDVVGLGATAASLYVAGGSATLTDVVLTGAGFALLVDTGATASGSGALLDGIAGVPTVQVLESGFLQLDGSDISAVSTALMSRGGTAIISQSVVRGGVLVQGAATLDLTDCTLRDAPLDGVLVSDDGSGAVPLVTLVRTAVLAAGRDGLSLQLGVTDLDQSAVIGSGGVGVKLTGAATLGLDHSVLWDNLGGDFSGVSAGALGILHLQDAGTVSSLCPSTCTSGSPGFVSYATGLSVDAWVLVPRPEAPSVLLDRDPSVTDSDGTIGDIGLLGGAGGAAGSWYADTDADGLWDGWELQVFGSLVETDVGDPDADGLDNTAEYSLGSWPSLADTDGDGVSDGADAAPLDPSVF